MILELKTPGDPKVFTWRATDLTDPNEPRLEQFCARFKTDDIAALFRTKFEAAKCLDFSGKDSSCKSGARSGSSVQPSDNITCATPATTAVGTKGPMSVVKNPTSDIKTVPKLIGEKKSPQPMSFVPVSVAPVSTVRSAWRPTANTKTTAIFTASTSASVVTNFPDANTAASTKKSFTLSPPKFVPVVGANDKSEAISTKPGNAFGATTGKISGVNSSTKETVTLGGFTFTGLPVLAAGTDKKTEQKANVETTKPANPFASFEFAKPTKISETIPARSAAEVDSKAASGASFAFGSSKIGSSGIVFGSKPVPIAATVKPSTTLTFAVPSTASPIFGASKSSPFVSPALTTSFGNSESSVSFASIANNAATTTVGPRNAEKSISSGGSGFQNTGQMLFGKVQGSEIKEDDHTAEDADYEPMKQFTPVVTLPEVEVRTGEEDEEKIFGERARLYRMDGNQWKVSKLKINLLWSGSKRLWFANLFRYYTVLH